MSFKVGEVLIKGPIVMRRATAAPATGNHHLHEEEQKALLMEAFTR